MNNLETLQKMADNADTILTEDHLDAMPPVFDVLEYLFINISYTDFKKIMPKKTLEMYREFAKTIPQVEQVFGESVEDMLQGAY